MIGEHVLLLADRLADMDVSLEQAGFSSCLIDRDWMRSHSSSEEWRDFLAYKREYAREVILSSDPSKIELSNPGEYSWRSCDIAQRVLRRFQEFGDVHALFNDSSQRHLIELTVAAQRLSKMLERTFPADVSEWEQRMEEFNRRFTRELRQPGNVDPLVQGIYEDSRATWAIVQQLFVRIVTARVLGEMRAPGPMSVRVAPQGDPAREYVEFELELDAEKFVPSARGAMYLTAVYRPAQSETAQLRRLHVAHLLPGRFTPYRHFTSRVEFVLCFCAWLHVVTYATRALLDVNWRLCD